VYDGYVVCEEFADLVMDAWNQEQENKVVRDAGTVKIQNIRVASYRPPE
jgi:hypothetical protein